MECLSSRREREAPGGRARENRKFNQAPTPEIWSETISGGEGVLAGRWGGLFLGYFLRRNYPRRNRDHLVPPRRMDAAVCRAEVCYPFGRQHGRHWQRHGAHSSRCSLRPQPTGTQGGSHDFESRYAPRPPRVAAKLRHDARRRSCRARRAGAGTGARDIRRARGRTERQGATHADRRRANPHLEKQQAEPEPSSDCRLQRGRRAQGDGRSGRHGRRDPSAGMGSQCQRARGRGRAPTSQPVRDSRQFPARPAGEPQLDRRLERPAWDARAALRAAAAAPEDLVVGWHDGLALAGGRARWAADRAARARSATDYRSNRRAPSRTEADHRPLWQAGRNLVEPSRPHRNGQAPERGAQSHRGTELLAGALSLSRHPRPYSQALRCVRARADVLGTDITRMPTTWKQCVTMFTEELPWLPAQDKELIMGRALCAWLAWKLQG